MPLADPSETQVQTLWRAVVKQYDDLYNYASQNTPNLVTQIDNVRAALVGAGQYADDVSTAATATRTVVAGGIVGFQNTMEKVWWSYAKAAPLPGPERDVPSILTRLYDYFISTSQRVTSRMFTFGSVTASGSPVGGGTPKRLHVDANGCVIENRHTEIKTAKCIADQNSGAERHEEVFQISGSQAGRDSCLLAGSGARQDAVAALSSRASANFGMVNPSWDQPLGTSTITGWTIDTGSFSDFSLVTGTEGTEYYRGTPGVTTNYALHCTATFQLSQTLDGTVSGQGNVQFTPGVPVYRRIAWRRKSNATGALVLTLGSKSVTVDVSSVSNNAWGTLEVAFDSSCWLKQFNTAPLKFTVGWTRGAGEIDLDDGLLAPFSTDKDGGWWVFPGTPTAWRRDDTYTVTDTVSTEAKLQFWHWRGHGFYLPACPPTPTAACVGALAGAGAGNVENGTHSYKYTNVDAYGVESVPVGTSNVVTVVDKTTNGKVSLTGILAGPTGTASRKVYRTVAGDTGNYKLLTTISDNVTTTYTDNTADASLGANAPTHTLVAEPS